jgi:4,5-DOPA dioxygenase extradiol
MNRQEFIRFALGGALVMNSLQDFKTFAGTLEKRDEKMPLLFVGHGSPMNGIEDNVFSAEWQTLGKKLPVPTAVLCISAHWLTRGTHITAMEHPQTIHDFGGFPQALFDVQYPAPGSPSLAEETAATIKSTPVELDHEWGLDHGSWTVIRRMYPEANIPVLQLSLDFTRGAQSHYALAKELVALRKKGVLIMGSGNMVHNLRLMNWQTPESGFDWAETTNEKFKQLIRDNDHQPLIQYENLGREAKLSIPTPEHYLPMLYVLALKEEKENVRFFNDKTVMGSISMTSFAVS